jgi:hypothetical protein
MKRVILTMALLVGALTFAHAQSSGPLFPRVTCYTGGGVKFFDENVKKYKLGYTELTIERLNGEKLSIWISSCIVVDPNK